MTTEIEIQREKKRRQREQRERLYRQLHERDKREASEVAEQIKEDRDALAEYESEYEPIKFDDIEVPEDVRDTEDYSVDE